LEHAIKEIPSLDIFGTNLLGERWHCVFKPLKDENPDALELSYGAGYLRKPVVRDIQLLKGHKF
jgi:hypothetical protein